MATGAVKESEEERKRVRDVLVRQLAPRQAYDNLSFNAERAADHLLAPWFRNPASAGQ